MVSTACRYLPRHARVAVTTDADAVLAWKKHRCDACDREFNGDHEWADHLRSRKHWRSVATKERQAKLLEAAGGDPSRIPEIRRTMGTPKRDKKRRRGDDAAAAQPDSASPGPPVVPVVGGAGVGVAGTS